MVDTLGNNPSSEDWVLVRADALPEVYRKVLAAQTALTTGTCSSVSEAVRVHGLSRSAFYKYKDAVAVYFGKTASSFVTVELVLQDCPGVLSGLLAAFAEAGANISTVNQTSPVGGSAVVSICAQTDNMSVSLDVFADRLSRVPGVKRLAALRQQSGLSE